MLSLFAEQTRSGGVTLLERNGVTPDAPLFEPPAVMERSGDELLAKPEEFEIVLGRRQVASVLFIATVIIAILSGVSYLAGKSISPKKAAPSEPIVVLLPAPPPPPPPPVFQISDSTAVPAATPVPALAKAALQNTPAKVPPSPVADSFSNIPLFSQPVGGSLYLQMGALSRGAAAIFADGLRKHGFPGFVAPGPSDTLYRVLIGPLPDTAAYNRTKEALDRIGVATFGRKYDKEP
jgi:cell division septation protein DedD